jgi:hypothetical protein
VTSARSQQLAYVVDRLDADVEASCVGKVRARAEYRNGSSHFESKDVFPVNADATICNSVQTIFEEIRATTNVLEFSFIGTVPGPTEDIAVTGTVLVKTKHFPGVPNHVIATNYKIDKSSTAVGLSSGRTYDTRGSTSSKFKYIFPTATPIDSIASQASWCICCSPLTEPKCTQTCCQSLHVALSFDADGKIIQGESGASVLAPPQQGSCTTVVEVCN